MERDIYVLYGFIDNDAEEAYKEYIKQYKSGDVFNLATKSHSKECCNGDLGIMDKKRVRFQDGKWLPY